ncbi:MAG: diadenylate cyclase CdaA [Cytophagaceae bacterium]
MNLLFYISFIKITWIDIADILLVALILYQLYKLLKGGVAVKVFIGILLVYTFYLLVKASGMELLRSILSQFMGVGVLAGFILFQQEIRKFLLLIGKSTNYREGFIQSLFNRSKSNSTQEMNLSPIVEAVKILSQTKTGALIVISKFSDLKFYSDSGDYLDAEISKRLLLTIFNKNSPLHDGAVIISHQRLKAARCILPVSENDQIPAHLGLRHRAAIGLSEVTDAVIVVVSEETGNVSVVYNSEITVSQGISDIKQLLRKYLYDIEEKNITPESNVLYTA